MKAIIPTNLRKRKCDNWGCGNFGASRGSRKHNGIDYECPAGAEVLSPCAGRVTKLGFPYGDDLSYHYVQITDHHGLKHRIFYVDPLLDIGEDVHTDDVIGHAQDLERRYPEITPHIHYEVLKDGDYIDPEST